MNNEIPAKVTTGCWQMFALLFTDFCAMLAEM